MDQSSPLEVLSVLVWSLERIWANSWWKRMIVQQEENCQWTCSDDFVGCGGWQASSSRREKDCFNKIFLIAGLSSRVRKTISNTIRKESQTLLLLIQILFYSTCEVILELISLLLLAKAPGYAEKCLLDILVQKWLKLDSWKWRNGQLSGKCWLSLLNCISGFPPKQLFLVP